MLVTGLEQRLYVASGDANETTVLSAIDFQEAIKNILQVLPATDRIAIVLGASPLERYWKEQIGIAVEPLRGRVAFTWFNDLSFDEMLKQVSTLPPKSAVFFTALAVDAAGVPQTTERCCQGSRPPATRRSSVSRIPTSAPGWSAGQCCPSLRSVVGSWTSPDGFWQERRQLRSRHRRSASSRPGSTGGNCGLGSRRSQLAPGKRRRISSTDVLG
jgi:hypothetical protein